MEQNSLFHNRYILEKHLGGGNFSEVWLAKDTVADNVLVAIKIYTLSAEIGTEGQSSFAREFSIVVNVNHTNLLKPSHYDICDGQPYLVLPYCKKGSILESKGKFTEEEAWKLIADIADGIAYLHKINPPIIHQDIKPDNILIDDSGKFLLTDFGVSTKVKSAIQKTVGMGDYNSAGTMAYMAPERFEKDSLPCLANDIFSLGATVFEMLTGDVPFGENGGLDFSLEKTMPTISGNFSDTLKQTILSCLEFEAWKRPFAEKLSEIAHTQLQNQNKEKTVSQAEISVGRKTQVKNVTRQKKQPEQPIEQISQQQTPDQKETSSSSILWIVSAALGLLAGGLVGWFIEI